MRRLLEMQIFSIAKLDFFPLRYLGVPIAASRLHVVDWAKMLEKGVKKLDIWQGDSLSIAGRTTLINSSLINSTIYHMSMYLLPKTVGWGYGPEATEIPGSWHHPCGLTQMYLRYN
jgi:hypothetical protein